MYYKILFRILCLWKKCFSPNYIQKCFRQDENFIKGIYHEKDKIVFQNKDAKNNGKGRLYISSNVH